jgi:hypothetical protein
MGDSYQIIAFPDVTAQQAAELGERARSWLIERGILAREATDCVLSSGLGHGPGPNYVLAIIEEDISPELKPYILDFRTLWTNGMGLITGHSVFHPSEGAFDEFQMPCPSCGAENSGPNRWCEAVSGWYEGGQPPPITCTACGSATAITEWSVNPPWAFGYLGLKFWNWPPLKPEFLSDLAAYLGQRSVVVTGRL